MALKEGEGSIERKADTGCEPLDIILTDVLRNPHNKLEREAIFHLVNGDGNIVATIYPEDKYIGFHDEYTQTATQIEELKPMVNFLLDEENGYRCNLD